jgi:tRNA U34 5-methylaminomethyl-2-thiouridine-forming methyltransferase MnmC
MSDVDIIKTGDGSHTLYLKSLDETYHSRRGAVEESQYVYIKHGLDRLQNKESLNVLEVGFGTGLNIILTCIYAQKMKKPISVTTLEPYPIQDSSVLNYCQELHFSEKVFHHMHHSKFDEVITLNDYVSLEKKKTRLENFTPSKRFDVVYFDAFAPSKQSEIWSKSNLQKCFLCLNNGGVLTTYCAQGQFKRDLKAVGFTLENPPGPLGKKEMTVGLKTKKG